MDRLHYAGDSVVTGTAIAHALLDYAQALAEAGTAATVEIPTVNDDGSRGRSQVLIGPASQLIADFEESPYDEVVDGSLVADLLERAARTRSGRGSAPQAGMIDGDELSGSYSDDF